MTPQLIIILSLSASTVGFALLANYYRSANKRALGGLRVAATRINAALACLTPHSAFVGQKMARKLRGEA